MTDVVLFGLPPTTNTRTVQMVLAIKDIPHRLDVPDTQSSDYAAVHPFRKVPALKHGEVQLFEALAIATYLDRTFDGPTLCPENPVDYARMIQWVTATADYIYDSVVQRCVIERIVKPWQGVQPDEDRIAAAQPDIAHALDVIDAALARDPWLAGDQLSLADLFLAPIHVYLAATPEGQKLLPERKKLSAWADRIAETSRFAEINAMG